MALSTSDGAQRGRFAPLAVEQSLNAQRAVGSERRRYVVFRIRPKDEAAVIPGLGARQADLDLGGQRLLAGGLQHTGGIFGREGWCVPAATEIA